MRYRRRQNNNTISKIRNVFLKEYPSWTLKDVKVRKHSMVQDIAVQKLRGWKNLVLEGNLGCCLASVRWRWWKRDEDEMLKDFETFCNYFMEFELNSRSVGKSLKGLKQEIDLIYKENSNSEMWRRDGREVKMKARMCNSWLYSLL